MAFKIGKQTADLGVLAGGLAALAGGPFSLLALPALMKGYQEDQDEQQQIAEGKYATNALIRGSTPVGVEDPKNGITWANTRPLTEDETASYAMESPAFRPEIIKSRINQMFPEAETFDKPIEGVDEQGNPAFFQMGNRGAVRPVVGARPAAKERDIGSMVRLVGPRGQIMTVNEKSPEAQRMLQSGWNKEVRDGTTETGAGKRYQNMFGGSVEPGMQPEVGPDGVPTGRQVPIPGASKDPAVIDQNRIRELTTALPKVKGALDNTIGGLDQTITLIDDILSPASDTGLGDVTGFGGTSFGDLFTAGGTDAANVRAKIKQLESRTMLSSLADLKASSAGGASGLGALSEKEGEALRNASAALDRSQDMESYKTALKNYKAALGATKNRLAQTFLQEYAPVMQQGGAQPQGAPGGQPQAQAPAVPPPQARQPGQRYNTPRGPMTWTGTGWVP